MQRDNHLFQKYVNARYGNCTIVFDGYVPVPSTKDHEHTKRLRHVSRT